MLGSVDQKKPKNKSTSQRHGTTIKITKKHNGKTKRRNLSSMFARKKVQVKKAKHHLKAKAEEKVSKEARPTGE